MSSGSQKLVNTVDGLPPDKVCIIGLISLRCLAQTTHEIKCLTIVISAD